MVYFYNWNYMFRPILAIFRFLQNWGIIYKSCNDWGGCWLRDLYINPLTTLVPNVEAISGSADVHLLTPNPTYTAHPITVWLNATYGPSHTVSLRPHRKPPRSPAKEVPQWKESFNKSQTRPQVYAAQKNTPAPHRRFLPLFSLVCIYLFPCLQIASTLGTNVVKGLI